MESLKKFKQLRDIKDRIYTIELDSLKHASFKEGPRTMDSFMSDEDAREIEELTADWETLAKRKLVL